MLDAADSQRSDWIASDLAGLRQTALRTLGIGVMSLDWLWLFGMSMNTSSIPHTQVLLAAAILILGGLTSWSMPRFPTRVGGFLLVISMLAPLLIGFAKSHEPTWLYLVSFGRVMASTPLGFG